MTLSPGNILCVSSAGEFLSQIEPLIIQPRNFIGLEWMKRKEDETSAWSDAFETEQGIVLIDLALRKTIEPDL